MDAAIPASETKERRYTTISIPAPLYQDVKKAIEGTGFRSPTEFMVYVTRLSLSSELVTPAASNAPRPRGPPFAPR